jgi:hypothetical protein
MTLAKMAKRSKEVEGEKNKRAFVVEDVCEMEFFQFKDKKDNHVKASLKYVIQGIEHIMWANNEDEIKHLEKIFDLWISIKDIIK